MAAAGGRLRAAAAVHARPPRHRSRVVPRRAVGGVPARRAEGQAPAVHGRVGRWGAGASHRGAARRRRAGVVAGRSASGLRRQGARRGALRRRREPGGRGPPAHHGLPVPERRARVHPRQAQSPVRRRRPGRAHTGRDRSGTAARAEAAHRWRRGRRPAALDARRPVPRRRRLGAPRARGGPACRCGDRRLTGHLCRASAAHRRGGGFDPRGQHRGAGRRRFGGVAAGAGPWRERAGLRRGADRAVPRRPTGRSGRAGLTRGPAHRPRGHRPASGGARHRGRGGAGRRPAPRRRRAPRGADRRLRARPACWSAGRPWSAVSTWRPGRLSRTSPTRPRPARCWPCASPTVDSRC